MDEEIFDRIPKFEVTREVDQKPFKNAILDNLGDALIASLGGFDNVFIPRKGVSKNGNLYITLVIKVTNDLVARFK